MRKAIVALLGLTMMASLVPLTMAGEAQPVYYTVWTPDAGAVTALGGQVVETYGAFVLAQAGPAALDRLSAAYKVEVVNTVLTKQGVSFDTRDGDADLPADLRAGADQPYVVVQLIGPVKADWRAALLRFGDVMDYVPHNAFVVRADPGAVDNLEALPFVRFVAPFHPAYKLDPTLPASGVMQLNLAVWGGEAVAPVKDRIAQLGGTVLVESSRAFESYLRIEADAAIAKDLARIPSINAIEPFWTDVDPLDNANAAWVTQSGINPSSPGGGATLHQRGITGRGQVLAVGDTGLDTDSATAPTRLMHDAFADPNLAFQFGVPNPAHRKTLAYLRLTEGGVVRGNYDDSGHGTHTSGSVSSDAATFLQYNGNDGQSFGGKHIIMDVEGSGFAVPVDYANSFEPTYVLGARLHSNSYGSPHTLSYTTQARQNDEYTWTHQDFLIFRSMGNTGGNSIRPEAVAKNVVSSGATQNGDNSQNMATFSSRGPTQDGRVKPTVVAPGESVTSTYLNNGYSTLSGTSMSTPTTAGASGLIRQYFEEGWHGGSGQGSAPGINPSAALVRGVLINSAVAMSGTGTGRPGLGGSPLEAAPIPCAANQCPAKALTPKWPNGDQGWGLIRLDNTLKFSGEGKGLAVRDGLLASTGSAYELTVNVLDASQGLKVTLAWSDAPATAGANPTLVNDLDLVVLTPSGLELKGNVFLGLGNAVNNAAVDNLVGPLVPGGSTPPTSFPGGSADRRNVEEQVVFAAPLASPGTYTIRVLGANVPSGSQPFALVASGGF